MKKQIIKLIFLSLLLPLNFSFAEPWLANRFSQNCASCHAPGRVNVAAPDRRCTLSCQGCHVNPNGGGLRNEYGKWNQQRWLYSFQASQSWKLQKPRPEVYPKQDYADENLKEYIDQFDTKAGSEKRVKASQDIVEKGIPLKESDQLYEDFHFDRNRGAFEKKMELNKNRFMARIPEDDPLRRQRDEPILAGGDLRFFTLDRQRTVTDAEPTKSTRSSPMGADIGVQVRPYSKLSMVTEARFANPPERPQWDQLYTSSPMVRSAYLMVDDLPYNTFMMSGIYRPMFGNYNVDHNSLASNVTQMSYNSTWRTTSIGTAPNVPFFNFHYIQPMTNTASNQDSGYAINAGARFVTYGASAVFSYWDTKSKDPNTGEVNGGKNMISLAFGGMYKNWIANLDLFRIRKSTATSIDEGQAFSFENKFRFWREMYFLGNLAWANTAKGMEPGGATEYSLGVKSFLYAGMDVEALYIDRSNTLKSRTTGDVTSVTKDKVIQGQFHFYF